MSRRAQKQQSDRAPLSGTHVSNERGRQSKQKQKRRKSKPVLAVVPTQVSKSAPPALVAAASPHAAELAPARSPASLQPIAAVAACPLADGLPEVERSFFEGWSLSPPAIVAESSRLIDDDVTDDVDSLLLTPEQQLRRQWFRRQVTALMTGMGAFGTLAVMVHIASLL